MRLTARVFSVIAALALGAPSVMAGTSLRIVSSVSLPEGAIARDIRWAGPLEVYVSMGKSGVIKTGTDSTGRTGAVLPGGDRGGFPIAGLLARGDKHLFVASSMGAVGWAPLSGGKASGQRGLLTVVDIDARSDTAAILGADSGPLQGLARDGAIAWVGSLSKGLSDLRPLMKGRSNPGGKDMARCGVLQTGAIRFMPDGSVVVAPGAEPGIYRYSPSGKLLQSWDTAPLGVVDDCAIEDEELHLIARDFGERLAWYASRVLIDDILPTADGPAVLLRRVERGTTKWELVMLPSRGRQMKRVPLPVSVATPGGHVRGDVRGDDIVLLVFEDPLPGRKAIAPPRIVVLAKDGS